MTEGFDVRTLALTNLLMTLVLGVGLIIFSRIYPKFVGIKNVGLSYILMSTVYFMIGLRGYIPDLFSIIFANGLYLVSVTLLGSGILQFFSFDSKNIKKNLANLSYILMSCYLPIFIYFTYIEPSTHWRIIAHSIILIILFAFITKELFTTYKRQSFQKFISNIFLFCTIFITYRLFWTLFETTPENFMQAGVIHGLYLLSQQLLFITVSLALIWNACNELAAELSVQASIDPLTNIYNRRALEEIANKLFAQARREQTKISVVLIDIDNFKSFNDKYGHQVGDQVLIKFSQRLQNNLRSYDVLARYGGEEFIVILPDTQLSTAHKIAEKLRSSLSSSAFFVNEHELVITASFGISTGQGAEIKWEELVYQADSALYQAKRDGKNKVNSHVGDVINLMQ